MQRTYRSKGSVKAFAWAFFAIAAFCFVGISRGAWLGTKTWLDLSVSLLLLVGGAFLLVSASTAKVLLSEDSIAYKSFFSSRSLRFDQIRYRREYVEYVDGAEGGVNVYYLELVSREPDVPSLKLEKDDFCFDDAFWDCIYRIPDFEHLASG